MWADRNKQVYLDKHDIKAINKQLRQSKENRFKKAKVGERITSGGQAVVYHLVFNKSKERYVIKVLTSKNSDETDRYFWKIKAVSDELAEKGFENYISKIEHAFITTANGEILYCFIEKYVSCLSAYSADSPNAMRDDVEIAVRLGYYLLPLLQCCMDSGIIHRDIKPQNIFIKGDRLSGDFCLGDFGTVTHINELGNPTTQVLGRGTYPTAAPELWEDEDNKMSDLRKCDMYSFGITMYYYLNGRQYPYQSTAMRKKDEKCPAPQKGSPELKKLVLKAIEYFPEKRFSSFDEMLTELEKTPEYKRLIVNSVGLTVTGEVVAKSPRIAETNKAKDKTSNHQKDKQIKLPVKYIAAVLALFVAAGAVAFAAKNKISTSEPEKNSDTITTEIQSSTMLSTTTSEAWSELTSDLSALFADGHDVQDVTDRVNGHTAQKTTWLNGVIATAKQTVKRVTTTLKAAVTTKKTTTPSTTEQTILKGTCGTNLTWTLDKSTGELVISGTGTMTDWESTKDVPWYSQAENIKTVNVSNGVKSIGRNAFYNCGDLENVYLPNGIESLGSYSFSYCNDLNQIALPDSILTIGAECFRSCTSLETISFPPKLSTIEKKAFGYCKLSGPLEIPSSIIQICDEAFIDCDITKLTISEGCKSLGNKAFYYCDKLSSVSISSSVSFIGDKAFAKCFDLESFKVSSSNDYYCNDEQGVLFNKKKTTLIQFPLGISPYIRYTVPSTVTKIEACAFGTYDENSWTNIDPPILSLTIPESVVNIGAYAFSGMSDVRKIYMQGRSSAPSSWSSNWKKGCKAEIIWDS